MKVILLLLISTFLFSCDSTSSSQSSRRDSAIIPEDSKSTPLTETISIEDLDRSCKDTVLLEKMHFVGDLQDKDNNTFKVYTDYQELQMENSKRGVSNIILYGLKDTFSYPVDIPEDLPYKARNTTLFYCKNGMEQVFVFTDPLRLICTSGGCFEGHKGIPYVYR
jgi:hypothetical protein